MNVVRKIPSEKELRELYAKQKLSVNEIGVKLNFSPRKIDYWMRKYEIPRRAHNEASYLKHNPQGDPFKKKSVAKNLVALYSLGLGLYWGEGTKMNTQSIRLGNSDPALIRAFIRFLVEIYSIDCSRLRFGLQIFSDMKKSSAEKFWMKELGIKKSQMYKTVITPSRGDGTYRKKSYTGVMTVYFNNTKLRDILMNDLKKEISHLSSVGRAHPW